MIRLLFVGAALLIVTACQTPQQKNQVLLQERVQQLAPLSHWQTVQCRAVAKLTEPARARLRQLYPQETEQLEAESWPYIWRASETGCEVRTARATPMIEAHRTLVSAAFCLLLQTHYVNSPFDGLSPQTSEALISHGSRVQVPLGGGEIGMYVDNELSEQKTFQIETRTQSRGMFVATYTDRHRIPGMREGWLPERLEERNGRTWIVVENIQYSPVSLYGRTMIQSFDISVGENQAIPHTHIKLSRCLNP